MNSWIELPFEKIFLYIEEHDQIYLKGLKEFIEEKTDRPVELKGGFFQEKYHEGLEEKIAGTRVREKTERVFKEPLPKEVEIERGIIKEGKEVLGIIYDGFRLTQIMRQLLTQEEKREHTVVVTKRTVGTLEKNDNRYHVRVILASIPSLVSLSGIVEGPAKPRDYYLAERGEKEKTLDFEPMHHDDERMQSAVESYLLQTIFWRLVGDPFCSREECCLYNSHWQEEVIENQLDGELCGEHREKLSRFREEKSS